MGKQQVLFLCTGNSARSQMAEGLLRADAGDQFEVYSAGLEPKGINPYAIRAMEERGIDIRNQWSKSTKEYMGRMKFHYVITLCADADKSCPQALWTTPGTIKLHWGFDDPAAVDGTDEQKIAAFRETRDLVEARIRLWLKTLLAQEAQASHE